MSFYCWLKPLMLSSMCIREAKRESFNGTLPFSAIHGSNLRTVVPSDENLLNVYSRIFFIQLSGYRVFPFPVNISSHSKSVKFLQTQVCLFVCNRGDTYYSITACFRQGSFAKPLSLLSPTPGRRYHLSSKELWSAYFDLETYTLLTHQ